MMTDLELIDKVTSHLLKQKAKSLRERTSQYSEDEDKEPKYFCAYRSNEGLTCSIGCLIADEDYDEKIEGTNLEGLFEKFPHVLKNVSDSEGLLGRLQFIHDAFEVSEWPKILADLRREYGGTIR